MMLLATAKDKAFWERVRTADTYQHMRDWLLADWEAACTADIPACKFSEFILFHTTGSRREYEAPHNARGRSLRTSALLSLIYPDEEKYFTRLLDTIWAMLDEYTWCLPAHMKTFTEYSPDHIDLGAAVTGMDLAEIDYLLADRMPPLIRSRIRAEIDRRIITPYTDGRVFHWDTVTNNWSAVCAGNVCAAFLYQRPDLFEAIRPRVEKALSCYLAGFADDGVCQEGYGYWHYGFGNFVHIADLLRQFTDGKIDYFADPKVEKIASFSQRVYLDGHVTVSFSDGGASSSYNRGLLHYLHREYPATVALPPKELSAIDCGGWSYSLRQFLWYDETYTDTALPARTDYAPQAQWLIRTTERYGFAAKGGTNNEPHNHNDLGSFIVAKGGTQLLCDLGSGVYNKAYFSSRRYEDFHACSRGHSVPVINGCYQAAGAQHRASSSFEDGVFTVEFSRGYTVPELKKLTRVFAFTDDAILLTDSYEYDGTPESFVERFVTLTQPEVTPDGVRIGQLLLTADADKVASLEIHTEQARRLAYCIDYTLKPDARRFALKIQA